jgi:hypothetical protein
MNSQNYSTAVRIARAARMPSCYTSNANLVGAMVAQAFYPEQF